MDSKISFESCLAKQKQLKLLFEPLSTSEQKYQKLIELGQSLPFFSDAYKLPENLVKGCQSQMHLHAQLSSEGKIIFTAHSDALISRGLAALLLAIYSDEFPEVVLTCPPSCLDAIGIQSSLSPSRSNGLASLHLRMKQEALKLLQSKI
ncbi:MAG: SufE family protein [Parachlamydiales bacterium]|nr:SufE family protein [Candidatus Acheromyda pituitae]